MMVKHYLPLHCQQLILILINVQNMKLNILYATAKYVQFLITGHRKHNEYNMYIKCIMYITDMDIT